jgi:hypothetical protein
MIAWLPGNAVQAGFRCFNQLDSSRCRCDIWIRPGVVLKPGNHQNTAAMRALISHRQYLTTERHLERRTQ